MNFIDNYYEIASKMRNRRDQDEFLVAILRYYFDGEEPDFRSDIADVGFSAIRYSLDKARAGRAGGQANGQANGKAKPEAKAEANRKADAEADVEGKAKEHAKPGIGIGKDTRKEKPFLKEGQKEKSQDGAARRFSPPTPEQVEAYSTERGHRIDGEAFCDFYASKGWRVGSAPMRDWRAAVRTWIGRDGRQAGGDPGAGVERVLAQCAF